MYLWCIYSLAQLNVKMHVASFETDSESPKASLPEKFRNPELISKIRREYGLDSKNFSMVLTDYDLRPNVRTLNFS